MNGIYATLFITIATVVFLYVYAKDYGYKIIRTDSDTHIKAFVFLLPNILNIVLSVVQLILGQRTFEGVTFNMFITALMAGITEETIFRILPILFIFSKGVTKSNIVKSTAFSAVVFGLIHLTNAFSGVKPAFVVYQVLGAVCVGVLYSAVFIRTGSALSVILIHFFNDFVGFMDASTVTNGFITAQSFTYREFIDIGFCVVYLVLGIYLLRPAKHEEIQQKWAEIKVKPVKKKKAAAASNAADSVNVADAANIVDLENAVDATPTETTDSAETK